MLTGALAGAPVPSLLLVRRGFELLGLEVFAARDAVLGPSADPVVRRATEGHDLAATHGLHRDSTNEITLVHGRSPHPVIRATGPPCVATPLAAPLAAPSAQVP